MTKLDNIVATYVHKLCVHNSVPHMAKLDNIAHVSRPQQLN